MFDHRLIVFKVYFSHRHFHICFKWLFYNYLWLSVKFLLDLLWIFNLQNCYSNPHCSHKLDSSVSQASFLKQKRWLALATSFPTQSGNSSGHGSFLRTAAHQSRQPIVLINVLTLKRVCDTFSQTHKVRATHLKITNIRGQLRITTLQVLVLVNNSCSSCK